MLNEYLTEFQGPDARLNEADGRDKCRNKKNRSNDDSRIARGVKVIEYGSCQLPPNRSIIPWFVDVYGLRITIIISARGRSETLKVEKGLTRARAVAAACYGK